MMGTVFDRQLRIAIRGVMIRRIMTVAVITGRVATVIKSHGRTEVSNTTVLLGLQVTRACFTCGSTGHMARDFPKNGGNGGRGNGKDNQPAAKGRVFSLTKDQATNSSGFLNGRAVLSYLILVKHILCLVIIDHEYQNCPLRFDDKIRSANLFPLDMNDFDIKFWGWVV
ncbi:retrotransposon protein, putative, ty3-gypsy subclass [Tanacetum coccineum]|uniref:Retrotransposon protein, putative, ty3-gypsy subclass n=1 Tax=Tanacetum coccineum TaxID=301880 RepID=A0ABQ5GC96_9ASTR